MRATTPRTGTTGEQRSSKRPNFGKEHAKSKLSFGSSGTDVGRTNIMVIVIVIVLRVILHLSVQKAEDQR